MLCFLVFLLLLIISSFQLFYQFWYSTDLPYLWNMRFLINLNVFDNIEGLNSLNRILADFMLMEYTCVWNNTFLRFLRDDCGHFKIYSSISWLNLDIYWLGMDSLSYSIGIE